MIWQTWIQPELYKRSEDMRRAEMRRDADVWRLLHPRPRIQSNSIEKSKSTKHRTIQQAILQQD